MARALELMLAASVACAWMVNPVRAQATRLPASQFTLLPKYWVDLRQGTLISATTDGLRYERIIECSNEEFFCLKSDNLQLVWPNRCGLYFADDAQWSLAEVTTRLAGIVSRRIHHTGLRTTYYVVMTDGTDGEAFVMSDGRIEGALFDMGDGSQLRSMFAGEEAVRLEDLPEGVIYSPVFATVPLGRCEG